MANAQINVKFITNKRGGRNLAFNGYIYRVNQRTENKIFWKCTSSGCSASISTENDIPTGFGRQQHTHAADHTEDNSRELIERLPTFNTARSSFYRARRKQTPPLLKTTADIRLEGKWTETETGQPFLLLDDIFQNNRILAIATTDNLQDLAASETFFCDGTFYTCPSLFYQIFTISIITDDQMMPVVYALLPGINQATYTRLFTLLSDKMNDLGLQFSPTSALADFETAVHNSIRDVFPGITTKVCFFHFTQSLWSKAQITDLHIPYREDDNMKKLIRRAAVLRLVPLDSIEDVWFQAPEDCDEADLTEVTETFTDYVIEQWVNGDRLIWNHFGTNGPRTNNNLEAWHGKLRRMALHAHPNIYTVIKIFKDIKNGKEILQIQKQA
eukprot:XP_011443190.1 PREDICTED: uncharacterized protein LOC105339364 [Crassostrea gigas]